MTNLPEKELKGQLTKTQLPEILAAYPFAPAFNQTNTYFDTPNFALKAQNMGLRIRQFADYAEQTLKVPTGHIHHLREITDRLTSSQAQALLAARSLYPDGDVGRALATNQIKLTDLAPFASATTTRQIATIAVGDLVLDQTVYQDQFVDYDVELEYHNEAQAEQFFKALSTQFGLSLAPIPNKVVRAQLHAQKV